jgi:hypothetical protein
MSNWRQRFLDKYGGGAVVVDSVAADIVAIEELSEEVLDHVAKAIAEAPPDMARMRIKEPCIPCAKKDARTAQVKL